jgi:hypothetical protein
MKIIKPILTLLTALLLAPALRASEPTAESPPSPGALEALFANPPRDAGPEVWWHWPPAIPVRSVRRARVGCTPTIPVRSVRRARVGGKGNAVTREPLASMSDSLESLEANQSNPQNSQNSLPVGGEEEISVDLA